MKTSILLASVAAAGLATWLIKRKWFSKELTKHVNGTRLKHMTNVFSKAKTLATQ